MGVFFDYLSLIRKTTARKIRVSGVTNIIKIYLLFLFTWKTLEFI